MAKKLLALIRQSLNVTTATGEVTLLENAGHQGIRGIEMEMLQEGQKHLLNPFLLDHQDEVVTDLLEQVEES
ncbi:hypothetical protein Tco_0586083 [Tanacetum coccineum]